MEQAGFHQRRACEKGQKEIQEADYGVSDYYRKGGCILFHGGSGEENQWQEEKT